MHNIIIVDSSCSAIDVIVNLEKDFTSTGQVSQLVVEREAKKISQYKTVNQSYIADCIDDARQKRLQYGSVVQSYTLGNSRANIEGTTITQELILNIGIVSDHD